MVVNIADSHNYVQKYSCVSLIGPRNCILYQCPITSKTTIGLGTLGARNVKIRRRWSHVHGRCCNAVVAPCADRREKKKGLWLVSSPSSQKQIIQQLIHNNAMSLTSISLLDCTHLYEKFAVRERYRSAFAVTYLVCVPEPPPPHHPLHDSSQYI